MVGAALSTSSTFFMKDRLQCWNPTTDTFGDEFIGRIERVDRFKTIYNRPTRRETLTFVDGITLPDSGVIKRVDTNEVFLVSETIHTEIWQGEQTYEHIVALHRVTPSSGGVAVYQEIGTSGVGEDLGQVSVQSQTPVYLDIELRTLVQERDAVEVETEQLFAHFSLNVSPSPGDFFVFGGEYYRIANFYTDSGFNSARLVQEPPNFSTIIFKVATGAPSYDPATGEVTESTDARAVSCLIRKNSTITTRDNEVRSRQLDFFVYNRHIGFTPKVGKKVTFDKIEYEIIEVSLALSEQQWHIVAST
jgi:hypothetical protein